MFRYIENYEDRFISNFKENIAPVLFDNIDNISLDELTNELIKSGLFQSTKSIKCFLIDGALQLVSLDKIAIPIEYERIEETKKNNGFVDTGNDEIIEE